MCWDEEDLLPFTSGDSILLLPQFEEVKVQLVVLSDQPGVLRSVGLQQGVHVPALLLGLSSCEFGIA